MYTEVVHQNHIKSNFCNELCKEKHASLAIRTFLFLNWFRKEFDQIYHENVIIFEEIAMVDHNSPSGRII